MSATFMIVTNATANALSLTGDDRKPSVSIARAGTANINIVDVLGNQLLCDTLSTWVTAGNVTITRGGVAVTAAQLAAYKQGADMDRTDYDADDDLVVDAAETIDVVSRTKVTGITYTVLAGDTMIQTDSTANVIGLTLPAGVDGKTYIIKDGAGTAGTNAVTITPTVDTIEGAATLTLIRDFESITLAYDVTDTDWKVISRVENTTLLNDTLVQVVITAVGGVAGATAGTISVQVNDMDGVALTAAVDLELNSSLTQYAGTNAATGTAFFGAATTGTLNAGTGTLYAHVTTDATGLYEGALADAADETAYFSAQTASGGHSALANGCVVTAVIPDDATWAA